MRLRWVDMSPSEESAPTFETFAWAQEFADHLCRRGAPDPTGELFRLGRELYVNCKELDPLEVAETVWSKWPAENERDPPG